MPAFLALAEGASVDAGPISTAMVDNSLTWRDLEWLRSVTSLPILVKGILTAEDAALAVEAGVEGIVVSNHGGRQLDGAPASLDALPEIVEAVGGRAEVLLDSGIRRGADVVKALALGARAVLVGRAALYGLAVGGADGVERVLGLLREEIELALALCGCSLARRGHARPRRPRRLGNPVPRARFLGLAQTRRAQVAPERGPDRSARPSERA